VSDVPELPRELNAACGESEKRVSLAVAVLAHVRRRTSM
jgi:hypothetical protein